MEVKIDTKEKFHAISLLNPVLSGTMTDEIEKLLLPYLQNDGSLTDSVSNVVMGLQHVEQIDNPVAGKLVEIQQKFYEQGASFVLWGLSKSVEESLDKAELLELMNVTPTESEAWDIVQMEEIERELLGGEE